MLVDLLRNHLYAEKFDVDERSASYVFDVGSLGKVGLVTFNPIYWVQLVVLVSLQSVVNIASALVIYEFIISRQQQRKEKDDAPWVPALVGYGLICPLMVAVPFWLIGLLQLHNKAMLVGAAASACLLFFRCSESVNDTVPAFAKKSRASFVLYYASTVQFCFDPKTDQVIRASIQDILRKAGSFLFLALQATLLYSVLYPRNYELLAIPSGVTLTGLLAHLINNFAMASMTSVCLEVGATGVGLALTCATGINTVDLNDNPLTKSRSPSEFWNKRWNTLVSHGLTRGVFVPLRKVGCSKPLAAMATFVASGIMHEYIIVIIFYQELKATGQMTLSGTHLAFFAWNGVILSLEHYFGGWSGFTWIDKHFPQPIKTALVILTVLPLAHLFTQIYAESGFFTSFGLGFPRIEFYR